MSDLSRFLSNFDEIPCSAMGSKTGVLGLEIGNLLLKRSSVKSLVLCYGSTLTVDQLGLRVAPCSPATIRRSMPRCVESLEFSS